MRWWLRRIEDAAADRPWEVAPLLDLRRAAGALDVAPIDAALARAARGRLFVRTLAKQALAAEPPGMLLLRLRGRASRVDLEREGILPIVLLARCAALEAQSAARGTLERLDDARRAGVISERTHAAVGEAFRFLSTIAVAHRLRAVAAGRPFSAEIALSELAAIERTRLKDAFRVIRAWQEAAAYRYQPDLVMAGPPD
jgi:CBS domain-containing protein